jgi:hypothetical protein
MSLVMLLFLMLLVLAPLALLVWALVDLLRRPQSEWAAAGQNQIVWALVVVFVAVLGPILYLTMARPRLEDAARAHA